MNKNLAPAANGGAQEDQIDLVHYLDVLVANRWLIASAAAIVMLLGVSYALLARPIYQADILVQVEDNPNSAKSLLGDVSALFDVKTEATAEIEILRSRLVVGKAVDNLQLYISARPKYFPLIGGWMAARSQRLSSPGLFGVGGYAWGVEAIRVDTFDVPAALEGETFELTALGDGRYRLEGGNIEEPAVGRVGEQLELGGGSTAIRLLVRELAAKPGIGFELVRVSRLKTLEDMQGQLRIAEKGKQSGIIGASLEGTDPALTASILNQIADEYLAQNIKRKAEEAEKSLVFLNDLLPQLKAELERAEVKYNAMRNQRGTFNLSEEGKAFLQESVAAETNLQELRQKRSELLTRFTTNHPGVQAVDQQIGNLAAKVSGMSARMKTLPDVEQDTVRLMRDVQVNNDLYVSLLDNMQQLRLVKAGKVGNVRLIDSAAIPEKPVKPRKPMVVAVAAILGVLIGVVAAFVRKSLFGGISDPHDIEQHVGLPVFATVPLSVEQEKLSADIAARKPGSFVLASRFPQEPSIESLRSLRTALQFALQDAGNNRVLLMGPTPGVGKSFVSANLAAVLTMAGKRVLLIDADMRKGHLNQYFGKDRQLGLAELLTGKVTAPQAIQHDVVPGLDFISTGQYPANPAEVLLSPELPILLETFGKQYDLVLIDTPPVLAVSDTTILASHCATALLVTRFERTTLGEVREVVKLLQHANVEVKGVVFNALDPNTYRYGYGSLYGHYRYVQYGYASAQGPDLQPGVTKQRRRG